MKSQPPTKPSAPESKAMSDLNIVDTAAYEAALQPKTPAALDLFSPPSQVSTDRPQGKDTPPPSDLTATGTAQAGRGSRRARAVVNYAEPNLISKMRRPTKELADAVGKDGRPIGGAIVSKESDKNPQWQPKSTSEAPPRETSDEAPSPLVNKVSDPVASTDALEIEVAKTRKVARQSIKAAESEVEAGMKRSTSSASSSLSRSATEASTSSTLGRRRRIEEIKEAELAVYDFNESSPTSSDKSTDSITGRSHRRHSSMVDVRSQLEEAQARATGKTGNEMTGGKARGQSALERSSRAVARRKSMML